MSKLASENKFFDLSDYGRSSAQFFVNICKDTKLNSIHITLLFGISGLIAVYCILNDHYVYAGFFLILKSILDAADGEMSRVKNQPSYTGRYLDSIFDIILNFLILGAIALVVDANLYFTGLAFICFQLQGTLYNYYYVILRNKSFGADSTSKVFEYRKPKALEADNQKTVDVLFILFIVFYGVFDWLIYRLDTNAYKVKTFPNWFMTLVSIYGLGFQLLLIAIFLFLGYIHLIIPFFIVYAIFLFIFVGIRKLYL